MPDKATDWVLVPREEHEALKAFASLHFANPMPKASTLSIVDYTRMLGVIRRAKSAASAPTPPPQTAAWTDERLEHAMRVFDAEEAAQMGEPSPWDVDSYGPEQSADWIDFRNGRIALLRVALADLDAGDGR